MNRKFYFLTLIFVGFLFSRSFGQISGIGTMLAGPTGDAEKLLEAYFKPYANAFGANLNGAWYNTAKVHKLAGFDLTFSISTSFIPKADKEFDISTLGLSQTQTSAMSPTIAGKKTDGAEIVYSNYPVAGNSISYNLPKGTGMGVIPSPMIQLGIGLVKGTDITFRYVPALTVFDFGKVGLWGVGVKHSLKQWIPGISMLPFFNLSVFMGYTKMKTSADISIQPQFFTDNMNPAPILSTPQSGTYDNQKMEMEIKGFTGNLLASFDLPVVTFYGGMGFSTTTANIKLAGNYPMPSIGAPVTISPVTDPIGLKISNASGAKPRFTGGIKLKMAVITFHVDYTYSKYSLITTGLGISFR